MPMYSHTQGYFMSEQQVVRTLEEEVALRLRVSDLGDELENIANNIHLIEYSLKFLLETDAITDNTYLYGSLSVTAQAVNFNGQQLEDAINKAMYLVRSLANLSSINEASSAKDGESDA